MKKDDILLLMVAIGVIAFFIISKGGFMQTESILDIYSDARCSRSGDIITCSGAVQTYGACGFDYSKKYFNFCYNAGNLGDDLAEWIQAKLGENYALTSEQRQSVYDNLRLSGSCRFGYDKGTLWGNANDPSLSSDSCSYTYLFVDTLSDGSYSQINGCQQRQLGTCLGVSVDVNKCNLEYPQGRKSSQIKIFFVPYSEQGTFGSCSFTTRVPQPPVKTCEGVLNFDINKLYEVRSIAIWQKDACDNWHSYIPDVIGNTLSITNDDYCKVVPLSCVVIPPPKPSFKDIILKIWNWIRELFDNIFNLGSIIGQQTVAPNSIQTYDISISATPPTSNKYQYANWVLIDENQNILQEGEWETVNGVYQKSITITTPSQQGKYLIIATIYEYNWVNNQWDSGSVVEREAFDLNSKLPVPSIPSFVDILNRIWNWLKSLFSWL